MDVRLEAVLSRQAGVVARWQLRNGGFSLGAVRHFAAQARTLESGVYVTGHGPLTRAQQHWAAVLIAPDTFLAVASSGDAWGFRPWRGSFEVVVTPGTGGPRRIGNVLVCRSSTLAGATTTLNGLPITTVERTIVDLAASVRGKHAEKMVREALRLELTTPEKLRTALRLARGRRGIAGVRDHLNRISSLPFHRCRSDAEAMALQILAGSGHEIPDVNVRRAGEEADLSWPDRRLIIEIDGDQFHQDKREDARKTDIWQRAGWRVRRAPSGLVFDEPARFVAGVRRHLSDG